MNKVQKNTAFLLDHLVSNTRTIESVIISGFWRSGTTWLQELIAQALEAKTIFEPLDKDSFIPLLRDKSVIYRGYIPVSASEFSPQDWASLDLSFRGISPHRSNFSYLLRAGVHESFHRRLVIKFVRGQFILPTLIDRYKPATTIHISRHPMSIVGSMLKAGWDWSFDDIDLKTWYDGAQTDAVPAMKRLAKAELRETHQKVAALWAVTEQAALSTQQVHHCRYEDLVISPQPTFEQLMKNAGLTQRNVPKFAKDSPVSVESRKGVSVEARLRSWQTDLPQEVQADIRAVLRDFWPAIDDSWDLVDGT